VPVPPPPHTSRNCMTDTQHRPAMPLPPHCSRYIYVAFPPTPSPVSCTDECQGLLLWGVGLQGLLPEGPHQVL
jgi:hypothetical protein